MYDKLHIFKVQFGELLTYVHLCDTIAKIKMTNVSTSPQVCALL